MDLDTTIDFIIKDLNEIREIIDDLKKYPGVPELQVELAKSKCKSASEVIALLKNLHSEVYSAKDSNKNNIAEPKQNKLKEIDSQIPDISVKETKEVKNVKIQEVPPVSINEPVQVPKKHTESAIIADQFSDRPESFNEKLGSLKHDDDVLEILKTKPLSSLTEAIGINDKFLFIREIFDGNHESYNQAINKLESVGTLEDAMSLIMSYKGDDTSNEAIKQLIDLIKRKFPSHE